MFQPDLFISNEEDDRRRNLALIALFEEEFSIDWILEISGCKATEILSVVDALVETGEAVKKRPGIYCLTDKINRRDMVSSLSSSEKEQWHRSIASIFLREMPDEKDAALKAAGHLMHLKNDVNECRCLVRAGDVWRKTHHYQNALKCYLKAIGGLDKDKSVEGYALFIKAVIAYSKIFMVDPELGSAIPLLEKAIGKAENRNRRADMSLLKMYLALAEWFLSHVDTAIRHFDEGLAMAENIDDPPLKRSALLFNCFFLFTRGRIREVLQCYEKFDAAVDSFEKGRFPLLAAHSIATCYAYNGQIKRGMGILEGIYDQCCTTGDFYAASYTGFLIGTVFIELGQLDEAIQRLEYTLDQSIRVNNIYYTVLINLKLAYAHYRKNNIDKSLEHLKEALRIRREKGIQNEYNSYHNAELFWAMELGDYPVVNDASIDEDIRQTLKSENVLMKGIACRCRFLMEERKGETPEKTLDFLLESEMLFSESGHEIQLARTRMELARVYLSMGNEKKAKDVIKKSAELLDNFMQHQVPDNLRFLLKDLRTDKNLLEEILKLGQELSAIHSRRDPLGQILGAVNRITGAERGAVFILNTETETPEITLQASRNLTEEDISRPDFALSVKMIHEAVSTGEARFSLTSPPARTDPEKKREIHSRICVPLKLKESVLGVLYVDNRIFSSAFKKSDIKILNFFSVQAAIALDNARIREQNQALIQQLETEKQNHGQQDKNWQHAVEFIGKCPAVRQVLRDVHKMAATDATVLILGETGVGKELIANAIHSASRRSSHAFIRVNCSTFPETLIASELFGHEKGAFTGAGEKHIGRFELADGGTLFLDEIGDISPEVQVRLLRVLQSKEFERVGGRETLRSDFRLLAATNRDLYKDVERGKFREDLYYRLNVLSIHIPPLRERKEDIPLLIDFFLHRYAEKHGKPIGRISENDLKKLIDHPWPGNVRELKNLIERGAILSTGTRFTLPELYRTNKACNGDREAVTLEENERRHIGWALVKTNGKIRGPGGTAELLDINHNTLYSRMKKLGIQKPRQLS
jgi:formate hydrogenlyase transcriptional activator